MPSPYEGIPEDVLKEAANDAEKKKTKSAKQSGKSAKDQPSPYKETRQRRLIFKRRRAGVVLSREEVKAIKEGRKKLRREMKSRGIKSRREFELVAGSLGLYFDKHRGFLLWLRGHWLGFLIGLLLFLLLILFIFSIVTRLRGHFTINLSNDMFREGFVLSETEDFKETYVELFANPAVNVPCVSIKSIPKDVDSIDGEHNDAYFAYTYYIRNEGESTVGYTWELELNSESLDLSTAGWVMLFEDGELTIFAERNSATGEAEAIPPFDDNTRGYINLPVMELAPDSDQFVPIKTVNGITYYRVVPKSFESERIIGRGEQTGVAPMEYHKYTVVLWLEGDDADADNSKIGGHLGTQMNFKLVGEDPDNADGRSGWDRFWDALTFWD